MWACETLETVCSKLTTVYTLSARERDLAVSIIDAHVGSVGCYEGRRIEGALNFHFRVKNDSVKLHKRCSAAVITLKLRRQNNVPLLTETITG